MIYIEKDTTNNIVLTLTESSRLSQPHYLFIFTNEYNINATPVYWTSPDISSYPNRYNQFRLVESDSGSKTGGINVPLSLIGGQWKYAVMESIEETLDPLLTTGVILEEGRMVVQNPLLDNNTGNDSIYA